MNRHTLKVQANVKIGDKIRLGKRTYKVLNTDSPYYVICHTGLYRECLSYFEIVSIKNGTYKDSKKEKVGRKKGKGKYE